MATEFKFDNPLIVAKNGGFSRIHFSEEFLGTQTDVLDKLAANLPKQSINAGKVPGYSNPAHLVIQSGESKLFMRLNELKLTTYYRLTDTDICSPVWAANHESDFRASYIWKPNIPIWYVVVFNPPAKSGEGSPVECLAAGMLKAGYLIAIKPESPGAYRLPLCNLYPDGRICWAIGGQNYYGPTVNEGTLLERFGKTLDYIQASYWNAHLHENHTESSTRAIVKFKADGTTIAPPSNWDRHCTKVSNAYYNDLPLQQLTSLGL